MKSLRELLSNRPSGRIFINYRRQDAQWVAGRLADSLSAYFGDRRVFRDIKHIEGGAKFDDVIADELGQADAVIVLIGKDWLSASDAEGKRRLDAPDDWVALEIASALERNVPVYPILVEDTPMPRREELPERLAALARYNALSISDSRWDEDVTRVARVAALDIPSETERKLRIVNVIASGALALFVTLLVSAAATNTIQALGGVYDPSDGACPNELEWSLIGKKRAGMLFVITALASAALLVAMQWVDAARRRYVLAGGLIGAAGTLTGWLLVGAVCKQFEPPLAFFMSIVTATLMLACMSLSGFKAK